MATLVKIHPDGREEFKDGGARVEAIEWENGKFKQVKHNRPVVGCSLLVGSISARSYSDQDYWLTTVVTEIIEETKDHVLFNTENSKYKLLL